jgi:hypothetical protein
LGDDLDRSDVLDLMEARAVYQTLCSRIGTEWLLQQRGNLFGKTMCRQYLEISVWLGLASEPGWQPRRRLDAVLFAGRTGAPIAAKAGYPSVQVPAGFTAGLNGKDTPDYPLGATFTGRAWSEPTLLRLAYAFEQASHARRPPPGYTA